MWESSPHFHIAVTVGKNINFFLQNGMQMRTILPGFSHLESRHLLYLRYRFTLQTTERLKNLQTEIFHPKIIGKDDLCRVS